MNEEIEKLNLRIKELETDNEVLHTINTIQAERLREWQEKLESKQMDKEIINLYESILGTSKKTK